MAVVEVGRFTLSAYGALAATPREYVIAFLNRNAEYIQQPPSFLIAFHSGLMIYPVLAHIRLSILCIPPSRELFRVLLVIAFCVSSHFIPVLGVIAATNRVALSPVFLRRMFCLGVRHLLLTRTVNGG
jgi:hypothetical protein